MAKRICIRIWELSSKFLTKLWCNWLAVQRKLSQRDKEHKPNRISCKEGFPHEVFESYFLISKSLQESVVKTHERDLRSQNLYGLVKGAKVQCLY